MTPPASGRAAPPIPKTLWSPLGPLRVRVVKRLTPLVRGSVDFGHYDPKKRTIRILADLDPWVQWQTLRHEWFHALVFDHGFHQARGR